MAKQIKHIYGSNTYYNGEGYQQNFSTSLYTVPSGRIAKIFPEYISVGRANSQYTSQNYYNVYAKVSFGNSVGYENNYSYYTYIDISPGIYQNGSAALPAYNISLYAVGPYQRPVDFPIIMSSGQEITIQLNTTAYGGTSYNRWNFMVIEEY